MPISIKKNKYTRAALYSTTALALLAATDARALSINEFTDVPPGGGSGDFSDSFGSANEFMMDASGVINVIGSISDTEDVDYFKVSNLLPGAEFSSELVIESGSGDVWEILDSSGSFITTFGFEFFEGGDDFLDASGTVPGDGMLVFLGYTESEEGPTNLTLNAPQATPEPGTAALLGARARWVSLASANAERIPSRGFAPVTART